MSLRVLACLMFVTGFSVFAWRNWFVSLCAALLLMAVLEHPDMPNSMAGIQGLNPWNILMLNVLLAWMSQRRQEGLTWDLPGKVAFLLVLYLLVIVVSLVRLFLDPGEFSALSTAGMISEYFVNSLKWMLTGFLLYDGCRSRERIQIALLVLMGIYLLLAMQVIRWMPLGYALASGDDLSRRASKIIQNEIGYNRVTLSMMLGGASWAVLALLPIYRGKGIKVLLVGMAGIIAVGQALTGGRTGYVCWAVVGFFLCTLRWRRMLPVIPAVAILVALALPGVNERMLQGFSQKSGTIVTQSDDYEITSGRTLIWPYVIDEIGKAPIIGHGRQAMMKTGLTGWLLDEFNEPFGHPHNAYLEMLFDNGIVGFLCVLPFYAFALFQACRLFLDRGDPLYGAVGGVACALILALLVASLGGMTFYPREGSVGMWGAIGLMLRVALERSRSLGTGEPLFPETNIEPEPALL